MADADEEHGDWLPQPDIDGPKPDDIHDIDWAIILWRSEGIPIKDIQTRLGYKSIGSVSGRIKKLRGIYGPGFLTTHSGFEAKVRAGGARQGGLARARKWDDIRKLAGAKFGDASVEAADLTIGVLRRYSEDEELRASLTLADAKILAGIAKDLGQRADEMVGSLPHESPQQTDSELFSAIDGAVETTTTRVILSQIEAIVTRTKREDGQPLELPGEAPQLDEGVIEIPEAETVEVEPE